MIKKRFISMLVLLAAVATGAMAQTTYKVSVKEGTEDATSWTIAPPEATTTGVAQGTEVTASYGGVKKVKSVKAVKKAAASLIVNPVVGQIIGSDGKNYDANATLPDGVTAVAMIAYLGNDAETSPTNTAFKNGLALALADVSGTPSWCSQTSATCLGTQYDSSTKFNDLAGIANTDALVNHTGHTHAAANAARGYNSGTHPAGTSAWFLPSAGQWDKMTGSTGLGLSNLGLSGRYWLSTENAAYKAWVFDSNNGNWRTDLKSATVFRVRACLAF